VPFFFNSRYTKYFGDVISRKIKPDFRKRVCLKSVEINPPPILNRKMNGCKPVLEIYSTHHYPQKLLFTTNNKSTVRYHKLLFDFI